MKIHGDECVGVTDGAKSFAPALGDVSARFKTENNRITKKAKDEKSKIPYVTIALLIPMTSKDEAEMTQIRAELQGAFLAQYRENNKANDQRPLIRLVLANPGERYKHWKFVTDELAKLTGPPHNLRAVVGFNESITEAKNALIDLTVKKKIPVVAGSITGDDFANTQEHPNAFPGLARVAPTNSQQAAALASFLKGLEPADATVVADTNGNDNYTSTLRKIFENLPGENRFEPEPYKPPLDVNDTGNLANVFKDTVDTICQASAEQIFFAGRPVHLRLFVNALGSRPCVKKKYTVISGSHASRLAIDPKFNWDVLNKGVTVRYTALAHPYAWVSAKSPKSGGSKTAYDQLDLLVKDFSEDSSQPIGPVSLTDSRTIIAYDAVSTATAGIRESAKGEIPKLEHVANHWLRLHGHKKVDGVSGWICLNNLGNPYNKAVAIVHLKPPPHPDPNAIAELDAISWPEGRPLTQECKATR